MLFRSLLTIITTIFLLVSCNTLKEIDKDKDDQKSVSETEDDQASADRLTKIAQETRTGVEGCFEIVFPISLQFSNKLVTANNWKEVVTAIKNEGEKPEFDYPINLIDEEGKVITASNKED